MISRILVTLGTLAIFASLFLAFTARPPHTRIAANEAAAVSALRTIYVANSTYAREHAQRGYAKNLSDLAVPPQNRGRGETHDWTIDPALASGVKAGYKFTYQAQSTKGDGKLDTFQITADPLVPGKTGNYHFFVDQTGAFHASRAGAADSSSPVLQ